MKISQKDLENLFDSDQLEFGPSEDWKGFDVTENVNKKDLSENVRIKKVTKKAEDEIKLRKIRKNLSQIKIAPSQKPANRAFGTVVLGFLGFAGITGFILFSLLNLPSLYDQIKWTYYSDYLGKRTPATAPKPKPVSEETPLSIIVPKIAPEATASVKPPLPQINEFSQNGTLSIEKINVNAPVIWNIDESKILDELKNGVVHYKGTSLPGEGGNVFIVGHSSNYFWIKSDYNNIFALLNKLVKGDRVEIIQNSKTYTYEVQDKKIVSPDQVEVLNSTNKEVLSLMTCWPIGTNINRLVVIAERI